MALEPARQLELFPEPEECVTCSISGQYRELLDRYGKAPFFRELDKRRATALSRVKKAATLAGDLPCHEPRRLEEAEFETLRKQARAALKAFDWSPGNPDPAFLWNREEYAERWRAEDERLRSERLASRDNGPAADEFADIPEFDPRGLSADEFRERLDRVPWFAQLGKPHPRDRFVDRIADWDEWGGPESSGASPMGPEESRWQEALLALPRPGPATIHSLWSSVQSQAFGRMPFEADVDPWHGPTAASSHGAWLAATIACCLSAGIPIPPNALRLWAWYARGHWPCAYSEDDELPRDDNGNLVQAALDEARLVVF
jgi:hypothetical protein